MTSRREACQMAKSSSKKTEVSACLLFYPRQEQLHVPVILLLLFSDELVACSLSLLTRLSRAAQKSSFPRVSWYIYPIFSSIDSIVS